ncbi:unnamed protein product [Lathyrus oleraceus]
MSVSALAPLLWLGCVACSFVACGLRCGLELMRPFSIAPFCSSFCFCCRFLVTAFQLARPEVSMLQFATCFLFSRLAAASVCTSPFQLHFLHFILTCKLNLDYGLWIMFGYG